MTGSRLAERGATDIHRGFCVGCGKLRLTGRTTEGAFCYPCLVAGRPPFPTPPAIMDFLDYFWGRVDCGTANECWRWTGHVARNGYGRIQSRGRTLEVHRVMWEVANRLPIPGGLFVLHHCDNPPCVNPAHLYAGTAMDNYRDMRERGRWRLGKKASRG